MDDVYTVGALGDLISSTRKNKKTKSVLKSRRNRQNSEKIDKVEMPHYKGKIKTENVQSEISLNGSSKIENVNIIKDKTSMINPNGLKKIKQKKCITPNEVNEETQLINPNKLKRKKIYKLIKPLGDEDKSQMNPKKLKREKMDKSIMPNDDKAKSPMNSNKLKRKKMDELIKPLGDEDKSQMNPKKLKRKKMDKSIMPNDDKAKSPMNSNKLKRKKMDKSIMSNDDKAKSPMNSNKLKRKKMDELIKPLGDEEKSPMNPNKLKKKKNRSIKPNSEKIENKNPVSKLEDIKSSEEYIEKESRTIFVGNVPVNVKMSAIKKLFKQFGEIETTRLRSVAVKSLDLPRKVSIIKGNFHPQRDTANVYVRFKTKDAAQKALCLNSTKFEQHTIRVDMSLNTDHKQNKKKAIFIGNLPYGIQEEEIWDFFRDCGVVSAVRVVRDSTTGVSKGFGFVDFESKECVEFAMQLQGKKIQNREIRIKRIDTKTNSKNVVNKSFIKTPVQFRRTKPTQNFQGETIKSKMHKKKGKPTKADLTRKKIAKQLNA